MISPKNFPERQILPGLELEKVRKVVADSFVGMDFFNPQVARLMELSSPARLNNLEQAVCARVSFFSGRTGRDRVDPQDPRHLGNTIAAAGLSDLFRSTNGRCSATDHVAIAFPLQTERIFGYCANVPRQSAKIGNNVALLLAADLYSGVRGFSHSLYAEAVYYGGTGGTLSTIRVLGGLQEVRDRAPIRDLKRESNGNALRLARLILGQLYDAQNSGQ